MRLKLLLNKSNKTLPFNYQPILTGALHKWIGKNNDIHENASLYSFSWLQNVNTNSKGIITNDNTSYFYSFHDELLAKNVLKSIINNPKIYEDLSVRDVMIQETPNLSNIKKFYVSSPIFVKGQNDEGKTIHYSFNDKQSEDLMTKTLKTKLEIAKIDSSNLNVKFNQSYPKAKTKIIDYNGIKNKVNICPIEIEGNQEQKAFAWNVGIGNSTGIGFGSIK